uniref:Uncharacterized protein n=1 Tax=Arundo donax TaxID=35708 RepID=A0A0A8YMH6_ARUDO
MLIYSTKIQLVALPFFIFSSIILF